MFNKKYEEIEIIGRGSYGSASLIKDIKSQQLFVAKKVIMSGLNEKQQNSALQESQLLQKLNHPNIVKFIESFIENGILIIIMEYCEEGDLAYHIKRKAKLKENFPEPLILNWFLQILNSLDHLHQRSILHRDLKTQNIFLSSNGIIKIGDFGISKILENTNDLGNTVVGTPYYLSPEIINNTPYKYKSDVWALGCILYELCTLKRPFQDENLLRLVMKIAKEDVQPIPQFYSEDLKKLVNRVNDHIIIQSY